VAVGGGSYVIHVGWGRVSSGRGGREAANSALIGWRRGSFGSGGKEDVGGREFLNREVKIFSGQLREILDLWLVPQSFRLTF
jgi:hypothetical protein